jgi:hypothetical protein
MPFVECLERLEIAGAAALEELVFRPSGRRRGIPLAQADLLFVGEVKQIVCAAAGIGPGPSLSPPKTRREAARFEESAAGKGYLRGGGSRCTQWS